MWLVDCILSSVYTTYNIDNFLGFMFCFVWSDREILGTLLQVSSWSQSHLSLCVAQDLLLLDMLLKTVLRDMRSGISGDLLSIKTLKLTTLSRTSVRLVNSVVPSVSEPWLYRPASRYLIAEVGGHFPSWHSETHHHHAQKEIEKIFLILFYNCLVYYW